MALPALSYRSPVSRMVGHRLPLSWDLMQMAPLPSAFPGAPEVPPYLAHCCPLFSPLLPLYGSINPANVSKKEKKSKCQICRDSSIEGILIVTENTLILFTYLVCSPRHIRIYQILSQHIIMLVPDVVTSQACVLFFVPIPAGATAGGGRGKGGIASWHFPQEKAFSHIAPVRQYNHVRGS